MNAYTRSSLFQHLLTQTPAAADTRTPLLWKPRLQALYARWSTPLERAIAGGFDSADVGQAFVCGYQAALQHLAPAQVDDRLASFCVTESGGNSPSAIQTRLTPVTPERSLLHGEKAFVSGADQAELLLVAARTGEDQGSDGKIRPRIVIVQVPVPQRGLHIQPLPPLPFAPSATHGTAHFDQVAVSAAQCLPGDGYRDYVKPFRTVEDIHVSAALLGWLLRVARSWHWPDECVETLLALLVLHQALAALPADASTTHLALAGARQQLENWLLTSEPHWARCPAPLQEQWQRDRALLKVAGSARTRRTHTAWERLKKPAGAQESS